MSDEEIKHPENSQNPAGMPQQDEGRSPEAAEQVMNKKPVIDYHATLEEAEPEVKTKTKNQETLAEIMQESRNKAKKIFDEKFSTVAANPNARKAIIIVSSLVVVAFIYFVFSSTKPPEVKKQEMEEARKQSVEQKKEELLKTATPIPAPVVAEAPPKIEAAPKLPEPPPIVNPAPPEPPPPPTPASPNAPNFPSYPSSGNKVTPAIGGNTPDRIELSSNSGSGVISSDKNEDLEKRRKASIMVLGGSSSAQSSGQGGSDSKSSDKDKKTSKDKKSDQYLGFGDGSLETISTRTSQAKSVTATYMGDLDLLIAQGKIIDAVLETAINTEIPGTLRGIVTRDVYGESGNIVLIPKGSRLVGAYSAISNQQSSSGSSGGGAGSSPSSATGAAGTSGSGGSGGGSGGSGGSGNIQPTRIGVIWQRIIRPDGVDFAISEPGVDDLGRAGITGYVDNKFWIQFASAFLTSYLIPNTLLRFTKLRNQGTSTTNSTSTAGVSQTSTTGTVGGQQLQDSLTKFGDIATGLVQNSLNTNTVITVDQGETMKVFINQDILFPPQFVKATNKVLK